MQNLESEADNTPGCSRPDRSRPPPWRVRMSARIDAGKALLPLPAGTTRIAGVTGVRVRRNALGAVHADVGVDWVKYEAQAVPGHRAYAPPAAEDSILPADERAVLEQVVAELRPARAARRRSGCGASSAISAASRYSTTASGRCRGAKPRSATS